MIGHIRMRYHEMKRLAQDRKPWREHALEENTPYRTQNVVPYQDHMSMDGLRTVRP